MAWKIDSHRGRNYIASAIHNRAHLLDRASGISCAYSLKPCYTTGGMLALSRCYTGAGIKIFSFTAIARVCWYRNLHMQQSTSGYHTRSVFIARHYSFLAPVSSQHGVGRILETQHNEEGDLCDDRNPTARFRSLRSPSRNLCIVLRMFRKRNCGSRPGLGSHEGPGNELSFKTPTTHVETAGELTTPKVPQSSSLDNDTALSSITSNIWVLWDIIAGNTDTIYLKMKSIIY